MAGAAKVLKNFPWMLLIKLRMLTNGNFKKIRKMQLTELTFQLTYEFKEILF